MSNLTATVTLQIEIFYHPEEQYILLEFLAFIPTMNSGGN